MPRRSSRWYVVMAVLAVQVSVSALGTIGVCMDRPHTHGGVPAPECLMHQHPASTAPEASQSGHHHHHGNSSPADTARLACSCSSDPLTLMTTEIAVIPGAIGIQQPNTVTAPSSERASSAPDMRLAPLSPPPRPSLS